MAPIRPARSTDAMPLDRAAAMNLLRFVCSFAWADLKVQQAERDLVLQIVGRLGLDQKDTDQVRAWLKVPPPEDEVDPTTIPREHRELFLSVAEAVVVADGRVQPAESDSLALFRALLRD